MSKLRDLLRKSRAETIVDTFGKIGRQDMIELVYSFMEVSEMEGAEIGARDVLSAIKRASLVSAAKATKH